ncbi:MAG: HisA/HisF-related TIM barrel protein [Phoenicibacter congonensis]|uniref:1-(5-phosphoribosyl)-5-[(5-phosphoribosylamino)methylideneamino] imidazole-4-carboxamide isomerase n=1 Tax=Phoenicibacter congonensis TaxID=1944646 RepID=A0AA43RHF9_9ACTN|nr:HisA/HisF-related TIM barrel protein [Phoenicibacter congonensis]
MIVFPAIDLIAGKVVRLEKGDRSKMTVYSEDPVSVAQDFMSQGATWLHVVDLSSAFEEPEENRALNDEAIRKLCQVKGLSIDVGGGVRSLQRIDELGSYGASRIALGTVLVKNPDFAAEAAAQFGELLVADIAAKDGQVKVNGWRDEAKLSVEEAVGNLSSFGFKHLVFTDISRDGMQTGIDVAAYVKIAKLAGFPVVASGGISSLSDISNFASAGEEFIEGCITGRALYEGAFTLRDALNAAGDKAFEGATSASVCTQESDKGSASC